MAYDRVVLVHGGMLGSWCWEKVLPLLGCDVVAVDLPGRSGAAPIPATFDNSRGAFFGCRHFSKANLYLAEHGKAPIDWDLNNAV